jgi:hypothetical protein
MVPGKEGGEETVNQPATNVDVDWDRLLVELSNQPVEEGWVTLEEAVSATGVFRWTPSWKEHSTRRATGANSSRLSRYTPRSTSCAPGSKQSSVI